MEALSNWWKLVTGTQEQVAQAPASGTIASTGPDTVQGGRKKRRSKTRRSTKKSRKSRLHRK